MMLKHFAILIVICCSVIEGFAQVSLKKSTSIQTKKPVWIAIGVALFIVEAILYTYALRWLDISTAYPLGALCFVAVAFLSRWLLRESITPGRWIGIGFIMAGCVLISV